MFTQQIKKKIQDILKKIQIIVAQLQLEKKFLSRLLYKFSNAHCRQDYFLRVKHVEKLLLSFLDTNVSELLTTAEIVLSGTNPYRNYQDNHAVKLVHASSSNLIILLNQCNKAIIDASASFSLLLYRHTFVPMTLAFIASISRVYELLRPVLVVFQEIYIVTHQVAIKKIIIPSSSAISNDAANGKIISNTQKVDEDFGEVLDDLPSPKRNIIPNSRVMNVSIVHDISRQEIKSPPVLPYLNPATNRSYDVSAVALDFNKKKDKSCDQHQHYVNNKQLKQYYKVYDSMWLKILSKSSSRLRNMGVTGLWELLSPAGRRVNPETLEGRIIAIDSSIWLVQFLKAVRDSSGNMTRGAHIIGFFRRICKLLYYGIRPVFVFDGPPPPLKLRTLLQRRQIQQQQEISLKRVAERLLLNQLKLKAISQAKQSNKPVSSKTVSFSTDSGAYDSNIRKNIYKASDPIETGVTKKMSNLESCPQTTSKENDCMFDKTSHTHEIRNVVDKDASSIAYDDLSNSVNLTSSHTIQNPLTNALENKEIFVNDFVQNDPMGDEAFINSTRRRAQRCAYYSSIPQEFTGFLSGRRRLDDIQINTTDIKSLLAMPEMTPSKLFSDYSPIGSERLLPEIKKVFTIPEEFKEYSVRNEDGTERFIQLPLDSSIDPDVFQLLPPKIQYSILNQLRDAWLNETRLQAVRSKDDSAAFSHIQLEAFLRHVNTTKEIGKAKKAMALDVHAAMASISIDTNDSSITQNHTPSHVKESFFIPDPTHIDETLFMNQNQSCSTVLDDEEPTHSTASVLHLPNSGIIPRLFSDHKHVSMKTLNKKKFKLNSSSPKLLEPPLLSPLKGVMALTGNQHQILSDDLSTSGWGTLKGDPIVVWDQITKALNEQDLLLKQTLSPNINDDNLKISNDIYLPLSNDLFDEEDYSKTPVVPKIKSPNITTELKSPSSSSQLNVRNTQPNVNQLDLYKNRRIHFMRKNTKQMIENNVSSLTPFDTHSDETIQITHHPITIEEDEWDDWEHTAFIDAPIQKERFHTINDNTTNDIIETTHSKSPKDLFSENSNLLDMSLSQGKNSFSTVNLKQHRINKPELNLTLPCMPLNESNKNFETHNHTQVIKEPNLQQIVFNSPTQTQLNNTLDQYLTSENVSDGSSINTVKPIIKKDNIVRNNNDDDNGEYTFLLTSNKPRQVLDRINSINSLSVTPLSPVFTNDDLQKNILEQQYNNPFPDNPHLNDLEHLDKKNESNTKPIDLYATEYELNEERKQLESELSSYKRYSDEVTSDMQQEVRDLLSLFRLPYVDAPAEAEAQCAIMTELGLCDGVISDDSDCLVFGAKEVYRRFFETRGTVEMYESEAIKKVIGLSKNELILLAMLLGCDYTAGVSGIGIVNALETIRIYKDMDGLTELREWATNPARVRDSGIKETDTPEKKTYKDSHKRYRFQWVFPDMFPNNEVWESFATPVVNRSSETFEWGTVDVPGVVSLLERTAGLTRETVLSTLKPVLQKLNCRPAGVIRQAKITAFFRPIPADQQVAEIRSKRIKHVLGNLVSESSNPKPQKRKKKKSKVEINSSSNEAPKNLDFSCETIESKQVQQKKSKKKQDAWNTLEQLLENKDNEECVFE